ncbi:hypothetical protein TGRH88_023150 [Toxoplasma gondii]|uniref:Uncharacterized protein n=1 Tax=Toxoplasma gondii TaxID=5811 RepID=A0A7J6KFZ9_TOXGO|nr:hypothetical protein TGRH88_023150 [Toxoplasma gondii]
MDMRNRSTITDVQRSNDDKNLNEQSTVEQTLSNRNINSWQAISDRRYAIVCNSQFHPFFIVLFGKFNMQHAAANS